MLKKPQSIITLLLFLGLWYQTCLAQDHYFGTLYNVKSRPLALGGAFTSIEDDLETVSYNPATFNIYNSKKDHRITLFLNPLASFFAFQEYKNNHQQKNNETALWEAAALFVKAIVFSGRFIDMGIIAGEEPIKKIHDNHSPTAFYFNDLWDNSTNTFFMSLKLAKKLSIGFSGILYHDRSGNKLRKEIGYNYGILLKPNHKLNVGLSYMDFPKEMSDLHLCLDRMDDETMNVGISYKLTSSTIFSLDVRNLTEEKRENVRELHFGFEQSIFDISALCFGFYKEKPTNTNCYSVGIGILDSNLIYKAKDRFSHHDFIINYTYIYQESMDKFYRWHFFSLLFRI